MNLMGAGAAIKYVIYKIKFTKKCIDHHTNKYISSLLIFNYQFYIFIYIQYKYIFTYIII